MVDRKTAQALAKWAIEDYMRQCESEDMTEVFEAANIMASVALNLVDTLANRELIHTVTRKPH